MGAADGSGRGITVYDAGMDAVFAQLPTIAAVIGTGVAIWRSLSARLDRIESRMDRHLEWHASQPGAER